MRYACVTHRGPASACTRRGRNDGITRGSTAFDNLTAFRNLRFLRSRRLATFGIRLALEMFLTVKVRCSLRRTTSNRLASPEGRFNDKERCWKPSSLCPAVDLPVTRRVAFHAAFPSTRESHVDPGNYISPIPTRRGIPARPRQIFVHRLVIEPGPLLCFYG
jgi:hypothetical protein